jgi:hypothetical protein
MPAVIIAVSVLHEAFPTVGGMLAHQQRLKTWLLDFGSYTVNVYLMHQ